MKVLVFTSLYPNNIWPTFSIFVKERMINFARRNGCTVKVVAPIPYFPRLKLGKYWLFSQVADREIIEGIEVHHPRYFIPPKIGMVFYGLLMYLSVVSEIKRIQKNFDFDIIDAHYVYPDGFAGVLLGHYFKRPVVVSARGSDINLYKDLRLIRSLLHYVLLRSDKVIAVSHALKETIAQLGILKSKIAVIPNGVDSRKFQPFPKMAARKGLGLPTDKRLILSVGNLNPNKGFDFLIKALKILLEKFHADNLSLIIVGEGTYRKQLEGLVHTLDLDRNVRLIGGVSHRDLYLWYNAADLFCLASGREGWPNVLLESLACGTPVVATRAGGIPEIIRSDKVGLLTERNERNIAEAISIALKKQWNHDEIVQYASQHTWDKAAQSVYEVFQSVLDNRPSIR